MRFMILGMLLLEIWNKDSVWWYRFSRSSRSKRESIRVKVHSAEEVSFQIYHKEVSYWNKLEWEYRANKISPGDYVWVVVTTESENAFLQIEAGLAIRDFSFWDYMLIGALVFGIFGFLVTMIWICICIATRESLRRKLQARNRNNGNQIDLPRIEELGHNQDRTESQVGLANRRGRGRNTVRVLPRRNVAYRGPLRRSTSGATWWNSDGP